MRSRRGAYRGIYWDRRPRGLPIGETMKSASFKAVASGTRLRRREFLSLMAGATAWTTSVHAQKSPLPLIGYLCPESPELFASRLKAFHDGLGAIGFKESPG